jgi:hypothetical protein
MSGQDDRPRGVHPAVVRARRVVGLYGDPSVTWSVVARLGLVAPVAASTVTVAVQGLHAVHGHLGPAPELDRYGPGAGDGVVARFSDTPFGDAGPLTRVALAEDGRELVVAVHHGTADGLGLLGYASALTGLDLPSSARGVPAAAEPRDFVRRSVRRLGEALLRPPVRVASAGSTGADGDVLLSRDVGGGVASTPALVLAATRAVRAWNAARGRADQPVVVALGLSRRAGTPTPPPDRDTAFARLPATHLTSAVDARRLLSATAPEPAFPVTRVGGVGPLLTRRLASRLGSTLLVSNLGRVAQPGLRRLEFWPVPAGPAGVSLGLASATDRTTVTLRMRRRWFTDDEAASFATAVVDELEAAGAGPQ